MNKNDYGKIYYYDGETEVRLGDEIKTHMFFIFKEYGRVAYLPGRSPYNHNFHQDGLAEVVIESDHGARIATVVDPETKCLKKKIKFIRRNEKNIPEIRPGEDPFIDS